MYVFVGVCRDESVTERQCLDTHEFSMHHWLVFTWLCHV